jgi:thioredoxin 1
MEEAAKPQLLCFSASWCHYCHQMEPVLQQLEAEGYDIRRIDLSKDRSSANSWGINALPTFVAVRAGKELGRVEGATSKGKLKALLD